MWRYEGTATMRSGDEEEEYEEFSGMLCQAVNSEHDKEKEYEQYSCVFCLADGGEHCGQRLV
jgi:hypothetical protein